MNHIFISYSKKDIAFARHLRRLLQEAGFVVWMDEAKLVTSQKWWPTIEHNVLTCAAFIVIMSPNSQTSDWVEREVLVAESEDAHKKIFPVLLAGRPWSRLGNIQYADMTAGEATVLPESLVSGLSEIMARYTGKSAPPPLPDELPPTPAPPQVSAVFEKPLPVITPQPARAPIRAGALIALLVVAVILGIGGIVITHSPSTPTITSDPSAQAVVIANTKRSPAAAGAPTLIPTHSATPVAVLSTVTPIPKITATELSIDGYATLYMRQTSTAEAQSWTPTSTLSPTFSNGVLAATFLAGTRTAEANKTNTALVIASYTHTPTITPTPSVTSTPSVTPTATPLSAGSKRNDSQAIAQVFVPSGCFLMGSTPDQTQAAFTQAHQFDKNVQPSAYNVELPQHKVCITNDFWLDETDVTNAAFDAFVNAGGYADKSLWSTEGNAWRLANTITAPKNDCATTVPDEPRTCVSFYEAEAYAHWRGGRLPTEAEWEYAAEDLLILFIRGEILSMARA